MKRSLVFSLLIAICLYLLVSPVMYELVFYLNVVVLPVVFFCLFSIVFFLISYISGKRIMISLRIGYYLAVIYSIALLILLFFRPNDQSYDSMNIIPFATISFYLSNEVNSLISFYNLAANIGLFIPYGLFLRIKGLNFLKTVVIMFLTISFIETMQLLTKRGSFDIDDIILNVFGAIIGWFFYSFFVKAVYIKT
ncbi:VanZ family protein [Cytobacillus purgationiresistens]|uniref:Glycopeptide antibiotics resistance protein n=1 Tax=Cytobacillus purgationiresistens TaxID=863449 RepID=A0ABU0AGR7_9BACI|nr:VanZ family protein [Cytobacillus purgationiresistens]MDQ0270443.1 glycopeptide antibiotics resistance protein [Cytobacillus purgationiresistens]